MRTCLITHKFTPDQGGLSIAAERVSKSIGADIIKISLNMTVDYGMLLEKCKDYDVLIGFFLYPAGFLAALVGKQLGKKVIVSIHGSDIRKYLFLPKRYPYIEYALKNADYVVSVAPDLLKLAHSVYPLKNGGVILNSIDINEPKEDVEDTETKYIGSLGMFRYIKGLRYLFEGIKDIGCKLLLVGDYMNDAETEIHEEMIEELGITVKLTGMVDHPKIYGYLKQMSIFVISSIEEGCPTALLEAMVMKKPIIATRVGAIPDIIKDGYNGLLIDPHSSIAIKEAIIKLSNDKELCKTLGENAYKTVIQMTPEKEKQEWMEVINSLREE